MSLHPPDLPTSSDFGICPPIHDTIAFSLLTGPLRRDPHLNLQSPDLSVSLCETGIQVYRLIKKNNVEIIVCQGN